MDAYWWANVRKFYTCRGCKARYLYKEDVRQHMKATGHKRGYRSSPWRPRKRKGEL